MRFIAQLKTWQLILIGVILPLLIFIVVIIILRFCKVPIDNHTATLFLTNLYESLPSLWFCSICIFIEKYVNNLEKPTVIKLFRLSNRCIMLISILICFLIPFIENEKTKFYLIPIYIIFIILYFFSAYISSTVISKYDNLLNKKSYIITLLCLVIFPLNIFIIPNKIRKLM